MDDAESVNNKKPIFFRILDFIGSLASRGKADQKEKVSKFGYHLSDLDRKSPVYESVKQAVALCDEAVNVVRQRVSLIKRVQNLNEKMQELECYDNLTPEEVARLKNLVERFLSLNTDRNALRFQITGFDKVMANMDDIIEDAKYILSHMEEAEKSQKILRRDLSLLQGEKSELEEEYQQMQYVGELLHKGSIALVIIFAVLFISLAFFTMFAEEVSTFLPAAILSLFLIIIVTLVYVFRRRLRYEIKLNVAKQHKIVGIINKKNVVFVYYTNFLNFVRKKYNVRSSQKLRKNISDYADYKNITNRFDHIRNSMYQTEKEIENFLREKNIQGAFITMESFAKTIDIEDKRKVYNDYATENKRLEVKLEELDRLNENIWNNLVILSENDDADGMISKVIQSYTDEVSNIVTVSPEPQKEAEEPDMEISDIEELFRKIEGINKSIEKDEKTRR